MALKYGHEEPAMPTPEERELLKKATGKEWTGGATAAQKGVAIATVLADTMVPKTPVDWAIFAATLPFEELTALGRVAYLFRGAKALEEMPEAIRVAAQLEPEAADIMKAGKFAAVPEQLQTAVRQKLLEGETQVFGPLEKAGSTLPTAPGTMEGENFGWTRGESNISRATPEPETPGIPQFKSELSSRPSALAQLTHSLQSRPGLVARGAIGGATASYATGQDPMAGFERGVEMTAPPMAAGKLYQTVVQRFAETPIVNSGIRAFGKALSNELPHLGGQIKTADDLDRLFRSGEVQEFYGNRARAAQQAIGERMAHDFGIKSFDLPGLGPAGKNYSFEAALEHIRQLEEMGYAEAGGPSSRLGARGYRQLANEAINSMRNQLNERDPGLGDYWAKIRKQYGAARSLTDLFRTQGVFGGEGGGTTGVNWPKVQDLLAGKYRAPLNTMLGQDAAEEIAGGARRGGSLAQTDISADPAHLRYHPPAGLSAGLGSSYKYTGKLPVISGSLIAPKGRALIPLLENYLPEPDSAVSPPPPDLPEK